jgi:LacI family transcriptional regulator
MPTNRATMHDVAALAGVSLKTVSRVVNDEPGVSEEKADRVRSAVARLGFHPNLTASNLRRGHRTASIGMLVQDLGNDFCAELLRAVEARARLRGSVVMSASLDEESDRERDLVKNLVQRRIDGLILMPATSDQAYLIPEVQSGLRVVVIDRLPRGIALDSVTTDNREGASHAVRHLGAHGHRRIAMLCDEPTILTAAERVHGFREGLAELGVALDASLLRVGIRTEADACRSVRELMAQDDPPTALFTARNVLTVGAVRALAQLGLSDRVALLGFDDFPTADLLSPGVTCVRQDVHRAGELAIDMLLDRIDGNTELPRTEVVSSSLVPRGSGEIPLPGGGAG